MTTKPQASMWIAVCEANENQAADHNVSAVADPNDDQAAGFNMNSRWQSQRISDSKRGSLQGFNI